MVPAEGLSDRLVFMGLLRQDQEPLGDVVLHERVRQPHQSAGFPPPSRARRAHGKHPLCLTLQSRALDPGAGPTIQSALLIADFFYVIGVMGRPEPPRKAASSRSIGHCEKANINMMMRLTS